MEQTLMKTRPGISSFTLHLIAMALMFCDHAWGTGVLDHQWLTWIGRIAFPIFAFMIVEGYSYTSDLKKYVLRILLFAVISEIPFNLMLGASVVYPYHQNVMWTFLISIGCLKMIDRAASPETTLSGGKRFGRIVLALLAVIAGYILSIIAMTDYSAAGVLTVVMFYLFRGRKWYQMAGQLIGLWWINCEILSGLVVPVTLFGQAFEIPQQGFAMLALIPIWLYNGTQGPHNKWIKYSFYAFYPVHILILSLIGMYL